MICLGIEGTAHTLGIGIVDDEKVLADVKKMYVPKEGGIHPRESSRFIVDNFRSAILEAIEVAKIKREDIELIAFSQGPGLGHCLGFTAVGARALALSLDIPIIGVNHCVAHIEIGNMLARKEHPSWVQPLVLYVSGANTQILMFKENRYRIFGETLDIGLGNMLDKFGRKADIRHPAGPKIEKLARDGKRYIGLPYVVKGNDLSFSGILTESLKRLQNNSIEDVCYSLQETSFAMMAEATERALCHLKSECLMLTGGVANNTRLQEMLTEMAAENSVLFSVPKGFCGDNGAMIAWTGLEMHRNGIRHSIEDTATDQNYRTDSVEISWAKTGEKKEFAEGQWKGAEAEITLHEGIITKKRNEKKYRISEIDQYIRSTRTTREENLLNSARAIGIMTPEVFDVDKDTHSIEMEYIEGAPVYKKIEEDFGLATKVGKRVRKLHDANIIHGDLTTSNMIAVGQEIYFIDFGLGFKSKKVEDRATDLLLLKKALNANHSAKFDELWENVLAGYGKSDALARLEIAEKRGRYL